MVDARLLGGFPSRHADKVSFPDLSSIFLVAVILSVKNGFDLNAVDLTGKVSSSGDRIGSETGHAARVFAIGYIHIASISCKYQQRLPCPAQWKYS